MGIEVIDITKLPLGYGDDCIIILTQLLDRYLIDQNFTFHKPNFESLNKAYHIQSKNFFFNFNNILDEDFFNDKHINGISSNETTKANSLSQLSQANHLNKDKKENSIINLNEYWFKELMNVNDKLESSSRLIYEQEEVSSTKTKYLAFNSSGSQNENSIKSLISDYIENEKVKIEEIQKKEKHCLNKDNMILSTYSKSGPRINSTKKLYEELKSRIDSKSIELSEVSHKLKKIDEKHNSTDTKHLTARIKSLNNSLIKLDIRNALINNSILNCLQSQEKDKKEDELTKIVNHYNHKNDFDEIL